MPKYKVGDVAALFSKPSAPKSDTGKKIQSMFDEFYKNSNKMNKPNNTQFGQSKKQINKENYSEISRESKKKKRKFVDDDSLSNIQETEEAQIKQKKPKHDLTHQNSKSNMQEDEKYFPRNKKKSKHFNNVKENASAFSKMHFDDGENENFSRYDSEEQKQGDGKKKRKKISPNTGMNENNDHEVFKSKFSKKVKKISNGKNQSDEFNIIDNSFNEAIEGKQSPEKKSKKKKNKKLKKDNIAHNDDITQGNHLDTEDIKAQNDDKKSKIKQKSKKIKNLLLLENSLNQDSETEENIKEMDEPSKITVSKKKGQKKPPETAERLSRTLFVGNLPVGMTRHALQKLFSPFGSIEACRLRGAVPVKTTIPKKVAAIKSEFHAGQRSCFGYVVFKDVKDATEALSLNGELVGDHHIVVNPASSLGEKKTYDEKRSVFIGNLPFDVEDEAIWSAFAACGEIEAVRAIRDPETGAGKGFGYVLFQNIRSKEAALKMDSIEISDRKIRIQEVKSNARKSIPINNKLNAMRRKVKKLRGKPDGPNSRKSLKKLMNKEKRNYQKKNIVNIFKKFSI